MPAVLNLPCGWAAMANEVLYRRWRPRRFAEVSGQDTVVQTLRQAVLQDRMAHAYLFCGPRGTGKTSTARIFAKAINCLTPKDGEPDATCAMCLAIDEGRALDLIEIDAASHNGVDDARLLRERVFGSGPAEAKRKVYIIDEVHMLSNAAFNALLKTLEEPPPWAVFILCTTEAHKVMPTIISRCQRYDFRRITAVDTIARLEVICKGEGIKAEPAVLQAIGRSAGGSLRDACNLLEQLSSAYGRQVSKANVEEMLGLRGGEYALPIVQQTLAKDVAQALATLHASLGASIDLRILYREIMEVLRVVLLLKSGAGEGLEYPKEVLEELRGLAQKASTEQVLRIIRVFAQANVKASTEGVPSLPLEVAIVDACMTPQAVVVADTYGAQSVVPPVAATPTPRFPPSPAVRPNSGKPAARQNTYPPHPNGVNGRPPVPGAMPRPQQSQTPPPIRPAAPTAPEPQRPPSRPKPSTPEWLAFQGALRQVSGKNYGIGGLLNDCTDYRIEGSALVLVFRNASNMERFRQEVEQPDVQAKVKSAVKTAFSSEYELKLVASAAAVTPSQPQGHLVRAAINLGARVIEDDAKEKQL
ncbi:MAG: DNA polymerase III subunit gamma/tau [Dehalococcoidia bacterium]|nr:DNA polymerase III subunit gamma/tau [Dehalococcoidia bacterium]